MPTKIDFKNLDDQIDYVLLKNRRLFLSSGIDSRVAEEMIRKIWFLEFEKPGEPITLIINSPGGSIDAGLAIWDQLKMVTSPVQTLVTGLAASMGSILSLAGDKGKRYATPSSRIMIHQPSIHGDLVACATDLEIHANEILNTRAKIIKMYAEATGKDSDTIEKALDRDTWMSPKEAIDFGLLDKIVDSYDAL